MAGKAAKGSKDKQMAAYLKERGVQRTTGQCPSCHGSIGNGKVHTPSQCVATVHARRPARYRRVGVVKS